MDDTLNAVELAAQAIGRLEPEQWGPWVVGLLKMLDEQARTKGLEDTFSNACLPHVVVSIEIRKSTGGWS